jgi:hypothetical protein
LNARHHERSNLFACRCEFLSWLCGCCVDLSRIWFISGWSLCGEESVGVRRQGSWIPNPVLSALARRGWLEFAFASSFRFKRYRLPTSLYCSAYTLRFSLLTIGRSLGQYFPWTDHGQRVVCRLQDPHHQPRPHTGTHNVWSSSLQRLCRCFLNVVLVRRAFMMGMLCRAIGSKMPVPIHDMTHEDTSPLQRKKSSFSEASCTKN